MLNYIIFKKSNFVIYAFQSSLIHVSSESRSGLHGDGEMPIFIDEISEV